MSDWISWIKAQSSDIVDTVKNETIVLSGSLVESVKEIADQASKAVESLAKEDDQSTDVLENTAVDEEADASLIEKLDLMAANTEDYIDSLASNMTSKIGNFLSKAIMIIPNEPEITLVSDRRSNLLLEMQKNPDTYATDYSFVADESQVKRFEDFMSTFSVKKRQKEIDTLLEEVATINDFFKRMVPEPLDYDTFWTRYFFNVSEIDYQENARSMALKEAFGNQGDVIWDDSDEDSPKDVIEGKLIEPLTEKKEIVLNDAEENRDHLNTVSEKAEGIRHQKEIGISETSALKPVEQADISNEETEIDCAQNNVGPIEPHTDNINQDNRSPPVPDEVKEKSEIHGENKDERFLGEVARKELKSLHGSSSPNSEGSFDIIRKESVQPLEVSTKDNKSPANDEDWGGWDDSPDSPTVK